MSELYYTPPSDEIFEEVRAKAMIVWERYDDDFGYVTKKKDQIKDLQNIRDNFMFIVAMFDIHNQAILSSMLTDEARLAIAGRFKDGGAPDIYNPFTRD